MNSPYMSPQKTLARSLRRIQGLPRYFPNISHPFLAKQSHGGHRSSPTPKPTRLRHDRTSLYYAWSMENLENLGDVTRISEQVVRVLGQNPGKFTLQGTNTYIIGSQNPYILVDTAEGLPSYIPILSSAFQSTTPPTNPTRPDVSDVVISHWHHDHVGGIISVLTLLKQLWENRNAGTTYTPPRLHKHPLPEGSKGAHQTSYYTLPKLTEELPKDLYTPSPNGGVFHDLSDGQVFKDASGAALLQILHTPGHTVDSIALHLPQDKALYTADTILGHGTAVFEDLSAYIASLNRMLSFGAGEGKTNADFVYETLYPGHGAVIANGRETIATYIKHRLERETQILKVLRSKIPSELLENAGAAVDEREDNYWTTWNVVRTIYKSYPESLWLPAARGVELHLNKLEDDGFVKRLGGEGPETKWKLLVSPPSTPSL